MIVERPKGNLSEFMRHFNIATLLPTTGAITPSGISIRRFTAILIDADNYLLELSR
jgi:hypothetical protein